MNNSQLELVDFRTASPQRLCSLPVPFGVNDVHHVAGLGMCVVALANGQISCNPLSVGLFVFFESAKRVLLCSNLCPLLLLDLRTGALFVLLPFEHWPACPHNVSVDLRMRQVRGEYGSGAAASGLWRNHDTAVSRSLGIFVAGSVLCALCSVLCDLTFAFLLSCCLVLGFSMYLSICINAYISGVACSLFILYLSSFLPCSLLTGGPSHAGLRIFDLSSCRVKNKSRLFLGDSWKTVTGTPLPKTKPATHTGAAQ
jgi:hypothetical protein